MKPSDWLTLATDFGEFALYLFRSETREQCLVLRPCALQPRPLIRIQSACLFAEAFCSVACDCGAQLRESLAILNTGGYLLYLFQEGRSLGLEEKMRIMTLECAEDVTTDEAMDRLELHDARTYDCAVTAMKRLGLPRAVSFMTNNELKIKAAQEAGFDVKQIPWDVASRKWLLSSEGTRS